MADAIPTTKEGVFGYPIKWQAYDHSTMGEKFKVRRTARRFSLGLASV
jgi:hypothetical protein